MCQKQELSLTKGQNSHNAHFTYANNLNTYPKAIYKGQFQLKHRVHSTDCELSAEVKTSSLCSAQVVYYLYL